MATTSHIDFVSTHFGCKCLSKIQDILCYNILHRIKDQLKANACRVQCDLGGGADGYLSLVLSTASHIKISNVPFDRPSYPKFFAIPPTANPQMKLLE